MSLVSELKSVEAKAASVLVKTGKAIQYDVLPALEKVEANAGTVEMITALISPAAEKIEVAGFALLGAAITAIEAAQAAGNSKLVNVTLDEAAINDIKALIPAVKAVKI